MNTSEKSLVRVSNQPSASSDRALTARFNRSSLLISLFLLLVILLLAGNIFRQHRQAFLAEFADIHQTRVQLLDSRLGDFVTHVQRMKSWSEKFLLTPSPEGMKSSGLLTQYTHTDGRKGWVLGQYFGQPNASEGDLLYLSTDEHLTKQTEKILSLGFEFLSMQRIEHGLDSGLWRSYFLSGDRELSSLYPSSASFEQRESRGLKSESRLTADFLFESDIFQLGLPTANELGMPYWTVAESNPADRVKIVSYAAPVFQGERFFGVVGSDLQGESLVQLAQPQSQLFGRWVIVTGDDKILLVSDRLNRVRGGLIQDLLTAEDSPEIMLQLPAQSGQPVRILDAFVVASELSFAPWKVLDILEENRLTVTVLQRMQWDLALLLLLYGLILGALFWSRKLFFKPAFELLRFFRFASTEPSFAPPKLPNFWRPWAESVSLTFEASHRMAQQLVQTEKRLQQILNNSDKAVYVVDLQERIIFANVPFSEMVGSTPEKLVGQTLGQYFPPQTVDSMRHNEALALEQNSVMEFEETLEFGSGKRVFLSSRFPLFDAENKPYALCSIATDITQRKYSEEALREAAIGISAAKGDEVFNSLAFYLSKAVGTDFAYIGITESDEVVTTRAISQDGGIAENFSFRFKQCPANAILAQNSCFFPAGVQRMFPDDDYLQHNQIEGYAAVPLFDSDKQVIGLITVLHRSAIHDEDLILSILRIFAGRVESELEKERAERDKQSSELSYRAIFDSAGTCIFIHDLDTGDILDVNDKTCEVYGYSKEEIKALTVAELSSGEEPYTMEQARRYLTQAAKGTPVSFEWHRKNRDDSLHWDEVFLRRVTLNGQDRILAITTEVTERKLAEAALKASEEQYRAIFNASSDAMILWDAQGRMVDANPAAWNIGGYSREEFFDKPFEQHIHPDSMDAFKRFKEEVARNKSASTETRAIRKDGAIIDLDSKSIAIQYRGAPHILTITRDITEQNRNAEKLRQQQEALRQSEKLSTMGELLAGVAHELNNPLAILMGRAALLENRVSDSKLRTEVEQIHDAANRCGRIVRTFLNMARQKPPERTPTDLNDVVNSALALLRHALHTAGIQVQSRLQHDLPAVSMDHDQIGQVIINLLVNAQHVLVEQSEPRVIEVSTGVRDGRICCQVRDNGPGIPAILRERIFDPFFTTKSGSLGTGIGLSASRGITREHGGDLILESSSDGACFYFWLPMQPSVATESNARHADAREAILASRVLVVDDEAEIGDLLVQIITSAGLEAWQVNSGQEALLWLSRNSCDLILSDIRMPDMDGIELWREVRKSYPELSSYMAFITGDTLSAAVTPFVNENHIAVLEKPFTPEQVLALIARLENN